MTAERDSTKGSHQKRKQLLKFRKEQVKAAIVEILNKASVAHDVDRMSLKLRPRFSCVNDEKVFKWCMELAQDGDIKFFRYLNQHGLTYYFRI